MPKYQAEDYHPKTVERLLHGRDLTHLRARKHGAAVIVESGPPDDAVKHLRLTRDAVHLWLLDIADDRGRWERTGERASWKTSSPWSSTTSRGPSSVSPITRNELRAYPSRNCGQIPWS
jgi:hypothetical protein